MPRIVVHASAAPADHPVLCRIEAEGFELVSCTDASSLLEEVVQRIPDALIYALPRDCREDLGVLRLVRHAVPNVPLVLLATEDSLETRRATHALRPIYYAVCPIDGAELCEVMRNAVTPRGRVY